MTMPLFDLSRLDMSKMIELDFASPEFRQGALKGIFAEWASKPPSYFMRFGVPNVIVGRYADVKSAYFDEKHFTPNPPDLPGFEAFNRFKNMLSVAQLSGEQHHRVRRLLNPSFTPAVMLALDVAIQAIVASLLDEVEALGGPFDGVTDFADHLVIRILFDGVLALNLQHKEAFIRMFRTFDQTGNLKPGEDLPDFFVEAQREALKAVSEIIENRRQTPRENDFVSALVTARYEADKLSDEELIANLYTILVGGQGTVVTSTAAMLLNLCKHPDQYAQLVADQSLIPQAIEECMRYQGAVITGFPRFATEDIELGGTLILRHMPVQLCLMAANRDPLQFADPLKFDIRRNPSNIMSFGLGAHSCLGIRLARRVLAVVLEQMTTRFPALHLQDAQFEPQYPGATGDLKPASLPLHSGL